MLLVRPTICNWKLMRANIKVTGQRLKMPGKSNKWQRPWDGLSFNSGKVVKSYFTLFLFFRIPLIKVFILKVRFTPIGLPLPTEPLQSGGKYAFKIEIEPKTKQIFAIQSNKVVAKVGVTVCSVHIIHCRKLYKGFIYFESVTVDWLYFYIFIIFLLYL